MERIDKEDAQVQYSMIKFENMLRKIQIDLIYKEIKKPYKYLEFFANEPKVTCSHLFLAKMIDKCQKVENFFE